LGGQAIESIDYTIGFGTRAGVFFNRIDQARGAPIVKKENALTDTP